MIKLEYKKVESQRAISRFGKLRTSKGSFDMPYVSPGLRTKYDCEALFENIQGGLYPQIITPYASRRNSVMHDVKKLLGISYEQNNSDEEIISIQPNILIIPDPEYEALSFRCTARDKFKEIEDIDKNFKDLFDTQLSNKNKKQVESVWNKITSDYGYTGIKDWATNILQSVESDIFYAPTHIIKSNVHNSVRKAFNHAYNILDEAVADEKFTLYGIHSILHWNIFKENNVKAASTRQQIYSELENWIDPRSRHSGLFFSFKIFDENNNLSNPNSGSIRRKILSHFISEISQITNNANGGIIIHNFGNWVLGAMDSGADIVTFRSSGPMEIEKPIPIGNILKNAKSGSNKKATYSIEPPVTPSIFNFDTLTDSDVDVIKRLWEENGTYPLPSCIKNAIDYWDYDMHEQRIYCARTRIGTLVEVGKEYRDIGIDVEGIPLSEGLRGRVNQSYIIQELIDLCPSLGNNIFSTYKEKSIFRRNKSRLQSYVSDEGTSYDVVSQSLISSIINKELNKQDFYNMIGEVLTLKVQPFEKINNERYTERNKRLEKIIRKIERENRKNKLF